MHSAGLRLGGHSQRVFVVKFVPGSENVFLSGGWDNRVLIYDTRVQKPVGTIPNILSCGECLDIKDDVIVAASYRNKDNLGLYSLSMRSKIQKVDFDSSSRMDSDSGFLFCARFSKPDASVFFAAGGGKNDLKVFDNTSGNTQ